ncbi:hypothetical protein GTS_03740 [Gandjariella thermophila]|uniref:Lantibiotic dehydratase N-terminal domain-containing protein n=1 Tax=Gandjariella thermophila TaxID=1931992 RepID=A0A4D4IX14_9PSEU|nr:hypothetical protein GTS_03740 [Gandjariella thermophila]
MLRAAGLPARLWLSAAAPELFTLLRRLDAEEASYRRVSGILAEHLCACLVPAPRLTSADRRLAVEVSRRLKAGALVGVTDCLRLAAAAEVDACDRDLARELRRLGAAADALARVHRRAGEAVASEKRRLLRAPWALLRGFAAGRRVLAEAGLPPVHATGADRASGATGRRLWQRSDRLWRAIAAEATAPASGQAALVSLGRPASGPLALTGEIAVEWVANARAPRSVRDAGVVVALAPLHRVDGDHLRVWAADPADPQRLTERRVRLTPVVAAVVDALRGGALRLADVERSVLATAAGRAMLRECVAHLADTGVLRVSAAPRPVWIGWQRLGGPGRTPRPALDGRHGGRRRVFRRASGGIDPPEVRRLEHAVAQVLRLAELIGEDRGAVADDLGDEPRPVLDVLAAPRARRGRHAAAAPGWPAPCTPGSGYARLLRTMADRADSAAVLDIGADLLDACGAAPAGFRWPVDCAVRPLGRDGGWALAAVSPAGSLDAPVAGGLLRLSGEVAHIAWYRAFLGRLERRTGMPVVELRVPGCAGPLHARAWTGDPDLGVHRADAAAPRYVPLDDLVVRRAEGRVVVVEAPEGPVWIVYHGPRTPPPPWDALVAVLRHTGAPAVWPPDLRQSVHALPGRSFVPRIAVAGDLVVSPAQWRLPRAALCDPHADDLAKARALARLRDAHGLPRWVRVSTVDDPRSLACDLESLLAVRVFDEVAVGGRGDVLIEEMVPHPGQYSVTDPADDPADVVAAEVLFRFPFAENPAALAAVIPAPAGYAVPRSRSTA